MLYFHLDPLGITLFTVGPTTPSGTPLITIITSAGVLRTSTPLIGMVECTPTLLSIVTLVIRKPTSDLTGGDVITIRVVQSTTASTTSPIIAASLHRLTLPFVDLEPILNVTPVVSFPSFIPHIAINRPTFPTTPAPGMVVPTFFAPGTPITYRTFYLLCWHITRVTL